MISKHVEAVQRKPRANDCVMGLGSASMRLYSALSTKRQDQVCDACHLPTRPRARASTPTLTPNPDSSLKLNTQNLVLTLTLHPNPVSQVSLRNNDTPYIYYCLR